MNKELSASGKEDLALALLLLRDFKKLSYKDLDPYVEFLKLVEHLGVLQEYNKLMVTFPEIKIEVKK